MKPFACLVSFVFGILMLNCGSRAESSPSLDSVPNRNGVDIRCETVHDAKDGQVWSWPTELFPDADEQLFFPLPAPLLRVDDSFQATPLAFERNEGQLAPEISFLARGSGCDLFMTSAGCVMTLLPAPGTKDPAHVLRMRLEGGNTLASAHGEKQLGGKINYFIGNEPARWHTNISTFARVRYADVYPGIDLIYYGNDRRLEYDFVIAPGADPKRIEMAFEGADNVEIDPQGDLRVIIGGKEMRWCRPRVFQESGSSPREVSSSYVLAPPTAKSSALKTHRVRFEVAAHDSSLPLIIDPVLVYSTYLGGSSGDPLSLAQAITADQDGNAYVTGLTYSTDFPTTNAVQTSNSGSGDAFVTKFSARGELVFSTYLGGSAGENNGGYYPGIAVDRTGSVYVVGATSSSDFPVANAFQSYLAGGTDGYVCKLSPDGAALVYSTYLGGPGEDIATCIAVDGQGYAFIGGRAMAGFPGVNVQNTDYDNGFVAKLTPSGDALVYSTFLGSKNVFNGIAVDTNGNAYVCGYATAGFPVTNALQPTFKGGGFDGFVAKLNSDGSQPLFSTFYGGSLEDSAQGIAIGPDGDLYISFYTFSADFPTVRPFQANYMGASDAAMVRMKPDGSSVVYSTFLGGTGQESVFVGPSVDGQGNSYLWGTTVSTDFPVYNPLQVPFSGPTQGFLSVLSHDGSGLLFSTYFFGWGGGLAVDPMGSVYIASFTRATNLWVTNAFQPTLLGTEDAFVTKFSNLLPPQVEIKRSGTLVTVSWPAAVADFNLESTAGFGQGASWSPVLQVPQVVGDQNVLVLDITNATQFFRLRQ